MYKKIVDQFVQLVSISVSRSITRNLAPVITNAVENAVRRAVARRERSEVTPVVEVGAEFAEAVSKRLSNTRDGGRNAGISIPLSMKDVVLFRRFQQVILEYKERIENEGA